MGLRVFIASLALSAVLALAAEPFQPGTKGKKLISYGQDWPNPAFCRQHVREMERRPFDGIVIAISKERQPQSGGASDGFSAFGRNKLKFEDYAHEIEDLRHTEFKKFTDNFIAVEAQPGDVDWFDDAGWQIIAQNFNVLARVANAGKCLGLEFDPEEYGGHPFTPGAWPEAQRKKHSDAEYVAKAKQRGGQVMRAMNAGFPRIKFFCLLGPSVTYHDYYHLYTPFIEGMCSAADEGTQIVDGFEQSYGFKTSAEFQHGRTIALLARRHFTDKPAFDRVMRFGLGLWMDNESGKMGWHPTEVEKNYFQPNSWQDSVRLALSWSDEYVWVWHERINFWMGKGVNEEYLKALAEARGGPSSK